MTELRIIAEPGVPQVIITREFAAPRDLLFRAYTDPELLARWLGPARLTLTVNQLDARHGGRWRYTHYDADGKGYTFHGLYHGTPTPERIVQTYEFEVQPGHVYLNTITFEERSAKTLLRQNTVFQSVEDRDGYFEGGMEEGVHESMAVSTTWPSRSVTWTAWLRRHSLTPLTKRLSTSTPTLSPPARGASTSPSI